jgi:hypothetical protein
MDKFNKIVGQHTCPDGTKCKSCGNVPKKLLRRKARAAMKRELTNETRGWSRRFPWL